MIKINEEKILKHVPAGYELVRVGSPSKGEAYIGADGGVLESVNGYTAPGHLRIIVKPVELPNMIQYEIVESDGFLCVVDESGVSLGSLQMYSDHAKLVGYVYKIHGEEVIHSSPLLYGSEDPEGNYLQRRTPVYRNPVRPVAVAVELDKWE